MARGHVRDLVRHHARQFGFAIRLQDQARVHEEEPAGQSESVHLFGIDHLDGERNFGVGIAHQVLADPVDVLGDDRVVDDLGLALHFLRQPLAEGDFLLQRPEIDAFADVPIADFVGIFLSCRRAKETVWQRVRTARKATGTAKKRFMSGKLLLLLLYAQTGAPVPLIRTSLPALELEVLELSLSRRFNVGRSS